MLARKYFTIFICYSNDCLNNLSWALGVFYFYSIYGRGCQWWWITSTGFRSSDFPVKWLAGAVHRTSAVNSRGSTKQRARCNHHSSRLDDLSFPGQDDLLTPLPSQIIPQFLKKAASTQGFQHKGKAFQSWLLLQLSDESLSSSLVLITSILHNPTSIVHFYIIDLECLKQCKF